MRYAALAFPLAFAGMPLYIHAPDFYATQTVMGLAQIGAILVVVRFFDAVQDPLIGIVSDKFAHRRGAIIYTALTMLACGFVMLFHPPDSYVAWWFGFAILLTTTAFSIVSVNYMAIGALWSDNGTQQTRIALYREASGVLGLLLACLLPPVLMVVTSDKLAYSLLAWVLFAGVGLSVFAARPVLQKHAGDGPAGTTVWPGLSALKPFAGIYGVYGLSMLASALPAVLVLFYVRDRLMMEEWTGLFLAAYFISAAAGLPVWKKLAEAYGAARCWLMAMLLAVGGFVWAYGLGAGDFTPFLIVCVITGIALGAELALPPALLAGRIHDTNNHDRAAGLNAGLTFLSKLALALAAGVGLWVLDIAGFKPDADNTDSALHMLSVLYALVPCGLKLCAAGLLWASADSLKTGELNATFDHDHTYGDRHAS